MFTKNWYRAIGGMMRYASIPKSVNYAGSTGKPSHYSSNADYMFQLGWDKDGASYASMYYLRTALDGGGGVILGTGTTTPTIEDYCLSGDIVTGYSYVANVSTSYDDMGVTVTGIYTITNTSDSPITIGEMGIICAYNSQTGASYKLLLERTVLENPITIDPDGAGQITYTIRMNYPTA